MLSKSLLNMSFYATGLNNWFLIEKQEEKRKEKKGRRKKKRKSGVIEIIPILINKSVFETSYNNLKAVVPKYNLFCTHVHNCQQIPS